MTRWNDSHRPYHRMLQQFTAAALVLLASVGWAQQVSATPGTVGAGPVLAPAIDPDTPTTLYAGTPCSGVLKSLDGGDSWSAVNTGLTPLTTYHRPPVRVLAIDPTTPTTLYAGTYGGVFRSLNGGSRIRVASENSQGSGGGGNV